MSSELSSLEPGTTNHEPRATNRRLRFAAWALKELVLILAVFSLATWGWKHWIDLRFAGPVVGDALPVLWTLSLLVLNFVAGPRIVAGGPRGTRASTCTSKHFHWVKGRAPATLLHALLLPSYLIIACLVANLTKYALLTRQDRVDSYWHMPITAPVLVLIVTWLYAFFRWIGSSPHSREDMGKIGVRLAIPWLALCLLGTGWFFFLQGPDHPPVEAVDVAVVFGHRVLPDGTASETLRARTLAAVDLYQRHLARRILVSGELDRMPNGATLSEAWAMREVCLQAGVPVQDILMDPFGDNTRATVYHAAQLMQRNNWHTVVACSSDYHLLRITRTFADAGIPAYTAAAPDAAWVPADPFDILRETVGLIVYSVNPHYRQARGQQMDVQHPSIVVHKSKMQLELFDGDRLVKTYACFTGTNAGDKEREGDRKTPEGTFHIVYKNPESKFHLSLGLDYPNREDARRGLESGLLTKAQYDALLHALQHGDMTTEAAQNIVWKTPLGGEIFIHGGAENRDTLKGSAGCVVVTNVDIEELYAICGEGTAVQIEP